MNNIKRFKFFVNENKENNKHIANIFNKYGKKPSEHNVAKYCYDNYKNLTGYSKDKIDVYNLEDPISRIGYSLKLNYAKFCDEWIERVNKKR